MLEFGPQHKGGVFVGKKVFVEGSFMFVIKSHIRLMTEMI